MQVIAGSPHSFLSPPHPPFSPLPGTPLPPVPVDTKAGLPTSPCRLSTRQGCAVDKGGSVPCPLEFFSKLPGQGSTHGPHLCPSQPQACLSDHRKAPYWTPSSENIQGNAHSSRQKGFI